VHTVQYGSNSAGHCGMIEEESVQMVNLSLQITKKKNNHDLIIEQLNIIRQRQCFTL
jgi:hypothetical protein